MNEIKVSVIIPVFNTEQYICECLDSLISQTLQEIEIVCVDDGSTDRSLEILGDYAQKDPRIKVFTQPNAGPSSARNLALKHVGGAYIALVDSDDFLSSDYLQVAYENAIEIGADCVINELYSYKDGEITHRKMEADRQENPISGRQALIYAAVWGIHSLGIWKRDLFDHISFNTVYLNGDEFTSRRLLAASKKVSFTGKGKYFYRKRANSVSTKMSIKKLDWLIEESMLREFLKSEGVYDTVKIAFESKFMELLKGLHCRFLVNRQSFTKGEISTANQIFQEAYRVFDSRLVDELISGKSLLKRMFNKLVFLDYRLFYVSSWIFAGYSKLRGDNY
jgi:glycosyltransferase involved in cell wall biosynthesis